MKNIASGKALKFQYIIMIYRVFCSPKRNQTNLTLIEQIVSLKRMLMQHDRSWVDKYDLSSLKYIMVAGENCNIAAWKWLRDVVGKNQARVVDCWWQTETGAVMMSPTPCPRDESSVPSTCTRGFYGIDPVLLDDSVWFSI